MSNTDREDIADGVISDSRLLTLLHEKDSVIYDLESKLGKANAKLQEIARTFRAIGSIVIK